VFFDAFEGLAAGDVPAFYSFNEPIADSRHFVSGQEKAILLRESLLQEPQTRARSVFSAVVAYLLETGVLNLERDYEGESDVGSYLRLSVQHKKFAYPCKDLHGNSWDQPKGRVFMPTITCS